MINDFINVSLDEFRNQIKEMKKFVTDPEWIWTLEYDIMINPKLGNELIDYINKIDLNSDLDTIENVMIDIKNKSICTALVADKEKDVVKKWYLYRCAYAYYGFLETVIEGSVLTTQILELFKKKYGDLYLEVLKKIDNMEPSMLTGFLKKDSDCSGREVDLYLLMKKWQDLEHLYHNNELIEKHNAAKSDFENYIYTMYPYLSDIKGRNLLGIYLLNKLPIIPYEQIFKFFDIGINEELANIIGGKNLGLAKLEYIGVSIPKAVAVSVDAVLNKTYVKQLDGIEDRRYSVRSSATVEDNKNQSFAGLFVTNLNVNKENIDNSIQNVYNSVLSERVMKYCQKFNTKRPYMSVVIQYFNEPKYSGVWLGNSLNSGILEWVEGNGEKLVSGRVTPSYENWSEKVNNPLTIEGVSVGEKCIELQKKLETVSDFEWCVVEDKLLFVQFRPVTVKINNKAKQKVSDNEIIGIPASSGIAIGRPNYLEEVSDMDKFNKGEILLADFTDPDWVPAMINSRAIVTAEGGFLSHSAIISRELGIPCVTGIGYKNIEELSKMKEIFVDGNNGLVCEAKKLKKTIK